LSETPTSSGDTMIPCTIETRDRVRDLKGDGMTYDRFLNEICDYWEKKKK